MYPAYAPLSYFFKTGVQRFSKSLEPPQNSGCQNGDMKQLSYWESTNIATIQNLFATATWRPGIFHPCCKTKVILSSHLCLGVAGGLFRAGFPNNLLYAFLFWPMCQTISYRTSVKYMDIVNLTCLYHRLGVMIASVLNDSLMLLACCWTCRWTLHYQS